MSKRQNLRVLEVHSIHLVWATFITIACAPVFAPLLLSSGYEPDVAMGALLQIGLGCCLIVYFYLVNKNKQLVLHLDNVSFGVFALLFWALLSLLWSYNHYEAWLKLQNMGAGVVAFFLVSQLARKQKPQFIFCLTLFVSGFIIAVIGIVQHWFQIQWPPQAAPPASTFVNKNFSSQHIILTLPLALYLFCQLKHNLSIWLLGLAVALMTAYLSYTQTRASWLAFMVQLILFSVWGIQQWRSSHTWVTASAWKIIAGCVCVCLLLIHIGPNGLDVNSIATIVNESNTVIDDASFTSGSIRLAMWANTLEIFVDHWFAGVGIGNWTVYYPLYHQHLVADWVIGAFSVTANAHNDHFELMAELGIIGILITLFVTANVVQLITQGLKSTLAQRPLFLTVLLSLVGIGVNAFFSFPYQKPVSTVVTAALLGLLVASSTTDGLFKFLSNPFISRNLNLIRGMLLSSVGLLILASYFFWRAHHGIDNYYKMMHAAEIRDSDLIVQLADETAKWIPWRGDVYYYKGSGYRIVSKHIEAIPAFEKALELYPYHIPSLSKISKSYLRLKDYPKARHYLQRLLETSPNLAWAHRRLGILLNNQYGDILRAVKHLETALKLDPDIKDADTLRKVINQYSKQTSSKQNKK